MPLRRLRCGRSAVCGAGCGAGSSPFEGTAACGFSRPLGGRMHCLDLLSSASPGFCRLRVQSSFGRTDALSRLPFECIAGSCRLRVQSSFGRTDALSRLPFECIAGSCRLRESVACPRGRDKPAGRSYAPGGGLRSGEPSRKRVPEHPVPSDDGERVGIAVRPKKIGTARERQPRPQTPAKELI